MKIAQRSRVCGVLLTLSIAALGACTTATPYQPYHAEFAGGAHGGYSDQRIAADRFIVRFHGNELTSRSRVEEYLLYRAAELTLQNGYDWFLIADRFTEHDVQTYTQPDSLFGGRYGYWSPSWRYYRPLYGWNDWRPGYGPYWADRADVRTVEAFEATADIFLRKGPVPSGEIRAIDARKVIEDLRPTIELPK